MSLVLKNQLLLFLFVLLFFLSVYSSNVMSCNLHAASMSEIHEQWMKKYDIVYRDAAEKQERFLIFKDNVEYIESFNAAGKKSYKLGINGFADLTNDEFRASHTGFKIARVEEQIAGAEHQIAGVANTKDHIKPIAGGPGLGARVEAPDDMKEQIGAAVGAEEGPDDADEQIGPGIGGGGGSNVEEQI